MSTEENERERKRRQNNINDKDGENCDNEKSKSHKNKGVKKDDRNYTKRINLHNYKSMFFCNIDKEKQRIKIDKINRL